MYIQDETRSRVRVDGFARRGKKEGSGEAVKTDSMRKGKS